MTSTQVAEMSTDIQLKCSSYNFTQLHHQIPLSNVIFFLYLITTGNSTNNKFITNQVNPKRKINFKSGKNFLCPMSSVLKCTVSGPKMASNTVTNLATNFLSFVLVVKS